MNEKEVPSLRWSEVVAKAVAEHAGGWATVAASERERVARQLVSLALSGDERALQIIVERSTYHVGRASMQSDIMTAIKGDEKEYPQNGLPKAIIRTIDHIYARCQYAAEKVKP